jgi:hypothetical protein
MTKLFNRDFATSITALLFAVMGISGVMMFFHFYDRYVQEMHEFLGLAFVAAVFLHIFFNFNAFKRYFSKATFLLVTFATLATAVFFVLEANTAKQNPKRAVIESVLNSKIQNYADFLHVDAQLIHANLQKAGIQADMQESIKITAQKNKISPFKLIGIIINKPHPSGQK